MARYWFRQKRFGYGATPNTWQGWVFTLVGSVIVIAITLAVHAFADDGTRAAWTLGALTVALVPFIWISYVKTEGGWRWRDGNDG